MSSPSMNKKCLALSWQLGPELLECRRLLSATIDLSLQGALWSSEGKTHPASVVPFRVDAVRTLGPASEPARIDGVGHSRIDGVAPVGGTPTVDPAVSEDVLTFTQVDYGSSFLTKPFERHDSEVASKSGKAGSSQNKSIEPAEPVIDVDWSRFEVFQDVKFTFAGGQIRAGLPTSSGLVSVKIVVSDLPPGVTRATVLRTGTGVFLARLDALVPPETDPEQLPPGNGPLGIPGDDSGSETPASPPVAPPPPAPSAPVAPTPAKPDATVPAANPQEQEVRQQQQAAENNRHLATATPQTTIAIFDRAASGRLGAAQSVHVVGLANNVSSAAAAGTTPVAAAPADPQPTMLLPNLSAVEDASSSLMDDAAKYLAGAAGSQWSALSSAAEQLFGAVPSAGGAALFPEIDYDALRRSTPFEALGLSPWQIAVKPADANQQIWKMTAGISFLVAVSGYWYCKEFSARRRQAQLQTCRAIVGKGSELRPQLQHPAEIAPPDRKLIGRVSRLWRDEVAY